MFVCVCVCVCACVRARVWAHRMMLCLNYTRQVKAVGLMMQLTVNTNHVYSIKDFIAGIFPWEVNLFASTVPRECYKYSLQ